MRTKRKKPHCQLRPKQHFDLSKLEMVQTAQQEVADITGATQKSSVRSPGNAVRAPSRVSGPSLGVGLLAAFASRLLARDREASYRILLCASQAQSLELLLRGRPVNPAILHSMIDCIPASK